MSFSLKGAIALFSGLGPGNWHKTFWRTFPSSTAHVQRAKSAVWMLSMVLLQMLLASSWAAPLGARTQGPEWD
jgi:hypothetical protein